jgi:nucleotide-binding universal stress UspA family protein
VSDRIVVGVDGSAGARSALLWAADEWRVRQCTLLIVHAPGTTLTARAGDPVRRALNELGEQLLNEHACAACAREPGVLVTTLLSDGPAAEALIDASRGADLLVVGTRGRGGNLLSILGSDSYRVAAHAHCPVAVVPEQLPPGGVSPRVVVGVSAAGAGRLAFGFALDEAQRRRATLVASGPGANPTRPSSARSTRRPSSAGSSMPVSSCTTILHLWCSATRTSRSNRSSSQANLRTRCSTRPMTRR